MAITVAEYQGKFAWDASEFDKGARQTQTGIDKFASSVGAAGKTLAVGFTAALGAASAAVVKIGKDAIEAYAEYEQLVGGVETLFKDSADIVIKNAEKAYQTAGLSANAYMETVTSFSASLLQSLGGDTVAAAQKADMAIVDMSDNANKMGSSMESIQNAYQGFAKQNYTMLDNLKLGYGGTKEEMARLLADAQAISGIEYDISSYADVVDAIHVIQTEMGITGTTAKEASTTIQGSITSMKAAWTNLLTGLTDEGQDFNQLVDNLFNSIVTVGDNLIPRVSVVLDGIANVVTTLAPKLVAQIPGILNSLLPALVNGAVALVNALVSALPSIVSALLAALPILISGVQQLISGLLAVLPDILITIVDTAISIVPMLVTAVIDLLPELLNCVLTIIESLSQSILDAIPILLNALPAVILSIVEFLLSAIPQLIETGISLLTSLVSALPSILETICAVLPEIINSIISTLLSQLPLLIQCGIDLLISLVQNLPVIISTICEAAPKIINSVIDALLGNLDKIIAAGVTLFVAVIQNLPTICIEICKAVPQIITSIVSAFGSLVGKMAEVGGNIVKGLWNGIQQLASWLWDKVSGWISSIWDGICDFFGIHSPSREMAWVGENLVKGLAGGIDDNGDDAVKSAENMSADVLDTYAKMADDIAAIEGDALGNASVNKSVKLSTSYDSNAVSPAVAATSANILDGFVSVFATFTNDLRDIFSGISISAGSGTTIAGAKTVNIKMGDITISGVVDKDSKEIVREIADEQVKELSDEIADVLNHS
ncbi:MAG: phage tail protein [Clostridia bacterium]|nr:phage tail protein [Clostridia bacterium]